MSKPRLVEVECIDHVIEQLKHVRDNYEGGYDEQGAELDYAIRQRDELLAALEDMAGEVKAMLQDAGSWGEKSYYAGVQKRLNTALKAITNVNGGE